MQPEPLPRVIHGMKFLEALGEAGIIKHSDRVRRVIIDALVNDAVVVHVERYGDERLLNIVHMLDGIEIREEKRTEETADAASVA